VNGIAGAADATQFETQGIFIPQSVLLRASASREGRGSLPAFAVLGRVGRPRCQCSRSKRSVAALPYGPRCDRRSANRTSRQCGTAWEPKHYG
jgi:hypothetical protein